MVVNILAARLVVRLFLRLLVILVPVLRIVLFPLLGLVFGHFKFELELEAQYLYIEIGHRNHWIEWKGEPLSW